MSILLLFIYLSRLSYIFNLQFFFCSYFHLWTFYILNKIDFKIYPYKYILLVFKLVMVEVIWEGLVILKDERVFAFRFARPVELSERRRDFGMTNIKWLFSIYIYILLKDLFICQMKISYQNVIKKYYIWEIRFLLCGKSIRW